MKTINAFINEARLQSASLKDLKEKLKGMSVNDRVDFLYGIRGVSSDTTNTDRMVDSVLSIDKLDDDKYVFSSNFLFKDGHKIIDQICKELGIKKLARILEFAIVVNYEDTCKILDLMPKYIDKFTKGNDDNSLWYHLTFDPKQAEEECAKLRRPFEIYSLEDEIKKIESEINTLQSKKNQLKKLKEEI